MSALPVGCSRLHQRVHPGLISPTANLLRFSAMRSASFVANFLLLFLLLTVNLTTGRYSSSFQQKLKQSDSLFNMYHLHPMYRNATVCKGFGSERINSWRVDPVENYRLLRQRFGRNCTHVSGNLIIAHLDKINGRVPDLSFLETIQEVSGYVVIFATQLSRIALPRLRIIRGVTALPQAEINCALAVVHNHNGTHFLQELDLRALRSVNYHDICFDSNIGLCYAPFTVNWEDILENTDRQKIHYPRKQKTWRIHQGYCTKLIRSKNRWQSSWLSMARYQSNESLCHESCPSYNGRRYCWGSHPDMCQRLHKCQINNCDRCFRKNGHEQCCHPECIVGCHGPKETQCEACRNFINGRQCVNHCPIKEGYDPISHRVNTNPNYRLYLGGMCVKNCTAGYLKLKDKCVPSCPEEGFITKNDECVPCDGQCPKTCHVQELTNQVAKEKGYGLDVMGTHTFRSVMKLLRNCTNVNGNIVVNQLSRVDDHHPKLSMKESIRPEDLWNLANIREFSGTLRLQLYAYPEVKNLTFLGNLTILRKARVFVIGSWARFLGWLKLRRPGKLSSVSVFRNKDLCYTFHLHQRRLVRIGRSDAKNWKTCLKKNLICHRACHPKLGCAGPGPNFCFACRHFRAGSSCVLNCNDKPGFFTTAAMKNVTAQKTALKPANPSCGRCHSQCRIHCTGPNNSQCVGGCRGLQNGATCVERCPRTSYANRTLQRCFSCSNACAPITSYRRRARNATTCSGPLSRPGKGGCHFCEYLFVGKTGVPGRCLTECPEGTYGKTLVRGDIQNPELAAIKEFVGAGHTTACRPCHEECLTCTGPGPDDCQRCRNYRYRNKCIAKCPEEESYTEDARNDSNVTESPSEEINSAVCRPCHELCRKGCHGPTVANCTACANFRMIEAFGFFCTDKCPSDRPFESADINSGDTVCYAEPQTGGSWHRARIIVVVICVVLLVAMITVVVVISLLRQRALAKKETVRLQAKYTGALPEEEMEPLNPSHTQPNFTHLRIVNERELRRGHVIGSGAFGTVFKAEWLPPRGKNDVQQVSIPVAIKVLTDASDPAENKELLEEARVMASVDNPYCMRLIGVCMTAQLQLISQFMPLGSLLEYLRNNSSSIGAKDLLTWAAQIAKGMHYLESRSIIHRDLAARNVLVQEPNHVRITDFGLAKLLDSNEEEYRATGGKMPVKWLALECIRHRRFTHKSDVWAYGVSLWELFTFGARPYSDLHVAQVCDFLDSGERLRQPEICTLDVYMLMIKCWMVDEDSRPNFAELAEEVSKMARDPGRYLVVKVDELPFRGGRGSQTLPSTPPSDRRSGTLGPAARGEETEEEGVTEEPDTEEELDEEMGARRGVEAGEEEYATPGSESAVMCRPCRPLKTTGAEPMSPMVAATPQHAIGATNARRYAGEVNRGAVLPPPGSDRKYGHLEAELAKHRGTGGPRWDRPRYATDPLDSPDATGPRQPAIELGPVPEKKLVVELPWKRRSAAEDEDDYLQPRTFAREASPLSQCDVLPPSPARRIPVDSPRIPAQVLNPDYFDTVEPGTYYNEAALGNRHLV